MAGINILPLEKRVERVQISVTKRGGTSRIVVNGFIPVIDFGFKGRSVGLSEGMTTECGVLSFEENGAGITVRKELEHLEHVVGFGEKAFELERKRVILRMWNNDPGGYRRGDDPLYASIPFFISVRDRAAGYFINSVASTTFDVGVSEYDSILVRVPEKGLEMYVFEAGTVAGVVEQFTGLTGMPFMPPLWALGHQVSRFSYYPEESVMNIAGEYLKTVPVSALYLDIDYMDGYKLFTWNSRIFGDPPRMIRELHGMGIRTIAIMDPGLKAEQGYSNFESGIGSYVETANRELYLGKVWPGLCAFPDFFDGRAVDNWKFMIRKFIGENGLDGLWLDMNEPSVFTEGKTIASDATHLVKGMRMRHDSVHNAYAYLEVRATYEAMKDVLDEPFILSRSGYAGIQKYAALWTGDSVSSWDDLRLQIPMVLSLGISGIPMAGCDVGGFIGRTEPELIARYYQMAAFFPVFRNHKAKDGNDQEIFMLPDRFSRMAADAVAARYEFMPFIYSLAHEAHVRGHPIVRPLFYEFQSDRATYSINDQYMLGTSVLYAPILDRGAKERDVYLPAGDWFSLGDGIEHRGPAWVSKDGMPAFVRKGSVIPLKDGRFIAYGKGKFTMFDGSEFTISSGPDWFRSERPVYKGSVVFLGVEREKGEVEGRSVTGRSGRNRSEFAGRKFSHIRLR